MEEEVDEYKAHAEALKDQGNEAFQADNIDLAIKLFTQAIGIDPDNHVYYSNRAAAYMKADSKSKALKDAEKCVELAPNWSKGYNRLGVAQQSLKRFDAAIDTFKKGKGVGKILTSTVAFVITVCLTVVAQGLKLIQTTKLYGVLSKHAKRPKN